MTACQSYRTWGLNVAKDGNCRTGERLATGVLAIGGPVATAPYGDTRLGADPIAVLPIASRSPV